MRHLFQTVGTYNIFLTSNKDLARKLGSWDKGYAEFIKEHSGSTDAAFLTSGKPSKLQERFTVPGNGVNILDFSHTFNF